MKTVLTLWINACLAQAVPPRPSDEFSGDIWYVLVVVAVAAFVTFYIVKRISDIVVKKKTDAMIREVGEPKISNDSEE